MGVDLETYRLRIGCFRHSPGKDTFALTATVNMEAAKQIVYSLLTLIVSAVALLYVIRCAIEININIMKQPDIHARLLNMTCNSCNRIIRSIDSVSGAVWFIDLLLLAAGVEPNPGPISKTLELQVRDSKVIDSTSNIYYLPIIGVCLCLIGQNGLKLDVEGLFLQCLFVTAVDMLNNYVPYSSFLLGNKGAHMVNGNPHNKGDTTLNKQTISMLETGVQESVGFITITEEIEGQPFKYTGTGFRVGDKYMMTAYHVFRNEIKWLIDTVVFCVSDESPDLTKSLNINIEGERVTNGVAIRKFIEKNATDIPLLLKHLGAKVTNAVSSRMDVWERKCMVEFVNHGQFTVGWKIPFGHEETDLLILPLIKKNDQQCMPKPLFLDTNFTDYHNAYLVRYIADEKPEVVLDTKCKVYSNDETLTTEVDTAVQWWTSLFPNENISYDECLKAHNKETGLVILKAAASFVYGSSGSPMVYLNSGQSFAGMIYQGGYPTFYYLEEENYNKRIKEKYKKEIDNDVLFERCTTMKKFAELLTLFKKAELKRNIFNKKLLWRCIRKDRVRDDIRRSEKHDHLFDIPPSSTMLDPHAFGLSELLESNAKYIESTEYMKRVVRQWEEDETFFIETSASRHICQQIAKYSILTIVGSSGSGKSFCMHHAALQLQSQGYELFVVSDCSEIKQFLARGVANQVFLVDDPIGEDEIDQHKLKEWKRYSEQFKGNFKESTKIMMTVRTELMNALGNPGIILNKQMIDIHAKQLTMSKHERKNYFKAFAHKNKIDIPIDDSVIEMVSECELQNFVLLVHMYCADAYYRHNPSDLFVEPLGAFETRLERMWEYNCDQLGGLVLCAINQDKLPTGIFDPFDSNFILERKKAKDLLHQLSVYRDIQVIGNELDKLQGVYINKNSSSYTFRHIAFKNIVLYVVAKRHHCFIMNNCDTAFCLERCRISRNSTNVYLQSLSKGNKRYKIEIRESLEDRLASKFVCTLNDEKYLTPHVFSSGFCHDTLFLRKMIAAIKTYVRCRTLERNILYQVFCNACLIKPNDLRNELHKTFTMYSHPSFTGLTPLIASVYAEDVEYIETLLSYKCDVNDLGTGSYETTPLCIASKLGNLSIVRLLLNHGANIDKCDGIGTTPLTSSVENGHNDVMNFLLENNADVNLCGVGQGAKTPLTVASKQGDMNIISSLLTHKVDVNKLDGKGRSALTHAVSEKHLEIIEFLIRHNVDVNHAGSVEQSVAPLGVACANGYIDTIHVLLNSYADINVLDAVGMTPITRAVLGNHIDVVKLLIKKDADVNLCGEQKQSRTPLGSACQEDYMDIIKLLLRHNTDVNKLDGGGITPLTRAVLGNHIDVVKLLIKKDADVNLCGEQKQSRTPLGSACQEHYMDIIKLLLKLNIDINKLDGRGITPLTRAVLGNHIDVVKLLIENDADVNLCGEQKQSRTPLGFACQKNHIDIIQLLLSHNTDVNKLEGRGITPLMRAVLGNHIDVVKLLIEYHAEVNLCGEQKQTAAPLNVACHRGYLEIITLLIQHNSDVNTLDYLGYSPLTRAVLGNHIEAVQLLLEHNADVNPCGEMKQSITPLGAACQRGYSGIVQQLIKHGANVNALDGRCYSPLTWAVFGNHIDIVKLLIKCNANVDSDGKSILIAYHRGYKDIRHLLMMHSPLEHSKIRSRMRKFHEEWYPYLAFLIFCILLTMLIRPPVF